MARIASLFSAIPLALGVLLCAGAAEASGTLPARTWVSGAYGIDSNPCSRTSPCGTFQGAYGKTAPGGEIDVADGGDFGALSISHSITVANDGAGVASASTITVNAASTDVVTLRGLNMVEADGFEFGVSALGVGSLIIDHCRIQGYTLGPGIQFDAGLVSGSLRVIDTVLTNDGSGGSAAVWVIIANGHTATAQFERVQILNSGGNGVRADSTSATAGALHVELHDVTVDGSTGGSGIVAVSATSGGAPVTIMADNVVSVNNAGYGFRAVGATATVILRHSVSTNNSVGLAASSGGVTASYSDNTITGNIQLDGAPTKMIAPE